MAVGVWSSRDGQAWGPAGNSPKLADSGLFISWHSASRQPGGQRRPTVDSRGGGGFSMTLSSFPALLGPSLCPESAFPNKLLGWKQNPLPWSLQYTEQ